jgi:large subunit ribosomal protein L25
MSEVLNVSVRSELGSNAVNRVRSAGNVPAVLYGHGRESVNLSIPAVELDAAIRHGSKMLTLKGGVEDTALLSDVQWDGLGNHVMHVDLMRVSKREKVHVTVPLLTRGDAIGSKQGGIVELMAHEIEIECAANAIPEKIEVRIHDLDVGHSIKAGEVPLPSGATLLTDAEEPVVQCVGARVEEEEEALAGETAEPEVIGRKAEEEEPEAG